MPRSGDNKNKGFATIGDTQATVKESGNWLHNWDVKTPDSSLGDLKEIITLQFASNGQQTVLINKDVKNYQAGDERVSELNNIFKSSAVLMDNYGTSTNKKAIPGALAQATARLATSVTPAFEQTNTEKVVETPTSKSDLNATTKAVLATERLKGQPGRKGQEELDKKPSFSEELATKAKEREARKAAAEKEAKAEAEKARKAKEDEEAAEENPASGGFKKQGGKKSKSIKLIRKKLRKSVKRI